MTAPVDTAALRRIAHLHAMQHFGPDLLAAADRLDELQAADDDECCCCSEAECRMVCGPQPERHVTEWTVGSWGDTLYPAVNGLPTVRREALGIDQDLTPGSRVRITVEMLPRDKT